MFRRITFPLVLSVMASAVLLGAPTHTNAQQASFPQYEYKLLSTSRVGTMEKEMNETAAEGYAFQEAVAGSTSFGGSEVVVIMARPAGASKPRYQYKLLATSKTSTMQKEMQAAGEAGFTHREETVFKKTFGTEVTVILERDLNAPTVAYDYKLLATSKTSTLQKEMSEAGAEGYEFVGVTNGETAFGGTEVIAIMRRPGRH